MTSSEPYLLYNCNEYYPYKSNFLAPNCKLHGSLRWYTQCTPWREKGLLRILGEIRGYWKTTGKEGEPAQVWFNWTLAQNMNHLNATIFLLKRPTKPNHSESSSTIRKEPWFDTTRKADFFGSMFELSSSWSSSCGNGTMTCENSDPNC